MSTQPTPEDLEALLLAQHPASKHYLPAVKAKIVAAMQAAVSRWGTPATGGEPVAWLHTDKLGHSQAFTTEPPPGLKAQCEALCKCTQPVREPLTPDEIDRLLDESGWTEPESYGFRDGIKAAENHHGIKGGRI